MQDRIPAVPLVGKLEAKIPSPARCNAFPKSANFVTQTELDLQGIGIIEPGLGVMAWLGKCLPIQV